MSDITKNLRHMVTEREIVFGEEVQSPTVLESNAKYKGMMVEVKLEDVLSPRRISGLEVTIVDYPNDLGLSVSVYDELNETATIIPEETFKRIMMRYNIILTERANDEFHNTKIDRQNNEH